MSSLITESPPASLALAIVASPWRALRPVSEKQRLPQLVSGRWKRAEACAQARVTCGVSVAAFVGSALLEGRAHLPGLALLVAVSEPVPFYLRRGCCVTASVTGPVLRSIGPLCLSSRLSRLGGILASAAAPSSSWPCPVSQSARFSTFPPSSAQMRLSTIPLQFLLRCCHLCQWWWWRFGISPAVET